MSMDLVRFCSVCFAASAALAAAILVSRSLALASLSLEEARLLADRRDLAGDTIPKLAKS